MVKNKEVLRMFYKKFIGQKPDYINRNPCSGKWNLAAYPEDYLHVIGGGHL